MLLVTAASCQLCDQALWLGRDQVQRTLQQLQLRLLLGYAAGPLLKCCQQHLMYVLDVKAFWNELLQWVVVASPSAVPVFWCDACVCHRGHSDKPQ
jgi:hypothetical protein